MKYLKDLNTKDKNDFVKMLVSAKEDLVNHILKVETVIKEIDDALNNKKSIEEVAIKLTLIIRS